MSMKSCSGAEPARADEFVLYKGGLNEEFVIMNSFNGKRPFQSIANKKETSECGPYFQQRDDFMDDNDSSNVNVPVIHELQKALDYLITRSEHGNVEVNSTPSSSHNPDSNLQNEAETHSSEINSSQTNANTNHTDTNDDETLHAIPNLINRILLEHYPASNKREKSTPDGLSKSTILNIDQKILMTQLLIAVIVEFAEPHFVRMSQSREDNGTISKKSRKEVASESSRSKYGFSKRAAAWATSCLSCLLQTALSTDESTHIPELDALLGATGEMDGMKIEDRIRRSILCGVNGSRLNDLGNLFDGGIGARRT